MRTTTNTVTDISWCDIRRDLAKDILVAMLNNPDLLPRIPSGLSAAKVRYERTAEVAVGYADALLLKLELGDVAPEAPAAQTNTGQVKG